VIATLFECAHTHLERRMIAHRLATGATLLTVLMATTVILAQPPKQPRPPRPVRANPALKEVPIDLDLYDAKRKVDPFLFVEPAEPYGDGKFEVVTGLLRRELYRQAFLLAGRDELGLTIRDGTLGEVPPDEVRPLTHRFRVIPQFTVDKPHEIAVQIGPLAASRTIWREAAETPPVAHEQPSEALTAAEAYSRTGYITALKRGGHRGMPNPIDPKAIVPPEAQTLLEQMTLTAQFAAVQLLHETLRKTGESPATLGAISRAYANLGMLTDTQWGAAPWVFKARGLLYAERLRQRDLTSPWGLWARAYASALAGMHAEALADLKAADAVRGVTPVPEWAVLADALCRFDTARLAAMAKKDGPLADTAAVFQFLTVENTTSAHQPLQVGLQVVKRIPECYRIHDALAETGGVGSLHRTTLAGIDVMSKSLFARVSELPGLPKAATDAIQANVAEPELVKTLIAAGQSRDDRVEPSWAALGQLIREVRVPQIYRRLVFLRHTYGVDPTEFLDEVKPLVADHPLYPYLDTYRFNMRRDKVQIERVMRQLKVPELTYRHHLLQGELQLLGETERLKYMNIALMHGDNLYYDGYLGMRFFTPDQPAAAKYGKRMLVHSPYAPIARAALINHDWASVKDLAAEWEKEAQQPSVLLALSRRAVAEGRQDDADRLIARALEFSPDRETYQILADSYKKKGDIDKWLATLERFLKEPDPGLGHARVRVDIAEYYMSKKEFAKAKPYADEAAETYAAWAMMCASKCAEGLGELDAAEKWLQRVSERYEDMPQVWFLWCLRNGRGDRDGARAGLETYLKKTAPPRIGRDQMLTAMLHVVDGEHAKAGERFLAAHRLAPHDVYLMTAALQFDAAGDKAQRDKVFSAVAAKGLYDPVVILLRSTLAKGEKEVPTAEEVAAALKQLAPGPQVDCRYFIGQFLLSRGQPVAAAEYFKRAATDYGPYAMTPALAGLALRAAEKK
jgi:tetratricopeptide (TPR) repeat protein